MSAFGKLAPTAECLEWFLPVECPVGPHEGQTGLVLDDLSRAELNRLEVPVRATRPQARALELGGDVFRRLAMFGAAGVAAVHRVVCEIDDVGPPFRRGPLGRERKHGHDHHRQQDCSLDHQSLVSEF